MSRKLTPIAIPTPLIHKIQNACCELFEKLHFDVYARIDGFITSNGEVFLNDPNTTSGMLPSSFFFHQAAEIGLNPSQFLTYIIRISLAQRLKSGKKTHAIQLFINELDRKINLLSAHQTAKVKVAVILGGYSSERHISVESGRNIFEKLSSSAHYAPIPVFLTGKSGAHELYQIPINILLKDNADDIKAKILHALHEPKHEIISQTIEKATAITQKYAGKVNFEPQTLDYQSLAKKVSAVFIGLHGRPGEDGEVQQALERVGLPYNGSSPSSSSMTIDKYVTKQILRKNGLIVAKDLLIYRKQWEDAPELVLQNIEQSFDYPLIAKPSDDGCSSAVMKIKSRQQMQYYIEAVFRENDELEQNLRNLLNISQQEEFPKKDVLMIEELISAKNAEHFLEITGGMLTKWENGVKTFEVFEPSEALAGKEILSLEEKFLAGEGQNITPARFANDPVRRNQIAEQVKATLQKAAELLEVEGYCRIDAFVRIYPERVETIVIEINSLPGMTPATCIFHQSAINGYKPYDFIDKILQYGINKNKA